MDFHFSIIINPGFANMSPFNRIHSDALGISGVARSLSLVVPDPVSIAAFERVWVVFQAGKITSIRKWTDYFGESYSPYWVSKQIEVMFKNLLVKEKVH